MWSPRVEQTEALGLECRYFVDCVENNQTPFNDGEAGLRIVKILEASSDSMKKKGQMVYL
jgi:UDP-N-acetylglucosamine 2-epimerase